MWVQVAVVFILIYYLAKWLLKIKFLWKFKENQRYVNAKIPGMTPTDPNEGNLPDLKRARSIGHFLCELHEKYGPVASFWEGKKLSVSICDPNLFKQLKHLFLIPVDIFEGFKLVAGEHALGFCEIEEIRRRRKLYEQHFMSRACKSYTKFFSQIAQQYVEKWKSINKDDHMPLVETCSRASLAAMSKTTYGDIFEDEQKLHHFQELNAYVFLHMQPVPPVDSEEYKKIIENVEELKIIVKEVLKERKMKKKNDDSDDRLFIDVLIEEEFTDEQRLADAFLMISAGYQTSSTHIAWTLYQLCKNQDIQEKLYQHLISTLGESPVTSEVIPKLTYLRQVLEEGLRHFVMHFFLVRISHEDLTIDGYFIPKGTTVYNATGKIDQNPEYFPNPEKFNPDHFTSENIRSRPAFAFKPFGYAGKRQCLGQAFAMTEAFVYIADWCRNYRFSLAPGQKENVEFTQSFVPEEEIWVTIEKRNKT